MPSVLNKVVGFSSYEYELSPNSQYQFTSNCDVFNISIRSPTLTTESITNDASGKGRVSITYSLSTIQSASSVTITLYFPTPIFKGSSPSQSILYGGNSATNIN